MEGHPHDGDAHVFEQKSPKNGIVARRPVTRQRPRNKLLSNGSANKHVSTETDALQQRNNVFYALHAEML
jgi:hypothetical protein